MKRPDTARVDFAIAREIAQRAGAKAVVAGSVVPAGSGYIVTARLVAAESRATSSRRITSRRRTRAISFPSVDRLTKSLRGKIGESLKTVRDAPPLEQVTHRVARRAPQLCGRPPRQRRHGRLSGARSTTSTMRSGRTATSRWRTCSSRSRCRRSGGRGRSRASQRRARGRISAARSVAGARAIQRGGRVLLHRERPDRRRYRRFGAQWSSTPRTSMPPIRSANALSSSRDYDGAEKIFQARARGRTEQRNAPRQPRISVHRLWAGMRASTACRHCWQTAARRFHRVTFTPTSFGTGATTTGWSGSRARTPTVRKRATLWTRRMEWSESLWRGVGCTRASADSRR